MQMVIPTEAIGARIRKMVSELQFSLTEVSNKDSIKIIYLFQKTLKITLKVSDDLNL